MKAINELLQATNKPLNRDGSLANTQSDMPFKDVTDLAQNRYGYQVPVLLSQIAYQRCVESPSARDGQDENRENLWLFKVLALAKYAIRHSKPGATATEFLVPLNDHKLSPTTETLTAGIYPNGEQKPVLLIKHTSEVTASGFDRLLDDLSLIVSNIKEAI